MKSFDSWYWRDADLAAIQLTANRFARRQIQPHRHVGFALSVCDSDVWVRTVMGVAFVPAGALLRIAPRVWHAVQARSAEWSERAIYCSGAVARSVSSGCADEALALHDDAAISIFEEDAAGLQFIESHQLVQASALSGDRDAASAARELLRRELQRWIPVLPSAPLAPLAPLPSERGSDARLDRLYALISTNFHDRLTLQSLAQEVGWHPVHLQRRFRKAWGFTPHELLVGHRVEHARNLIAGGAQIGYAAHAAGFFDQSHLHKAFVNTYAVVPGEYRRWSALDALQPASARNGIVD
jgi:AraC-like DNA-binding protein